MELWTSFVFKKRLKLWVKVLSTDMAFQSCYVTVISWIGVESAVFQVGVLRYMSYFVRLGGPSEYNHATRPE